MHRAGELDQQITIKRETKVSDGMGGDISTLVDVASDLWAHVRPRSGKEIGTHDRVEAPALYLFVIRYRNDIRNDDRIVWNGETYNIRAILTAGSRTSFLEINAERGVTQ